MLTLTTRVLRKSARAARPLVEPLLARRARAAGLAPAVTQRQFLEQLDGLDALEIGPFDRPMLNGPSVRYFDVLDTDGLVDRARRIGRNCGQVPAITYVSPVGDLAVVDRTFDAIFSSHAIEHQPDLVAHLQGVSRLLNAGGAYYVIVPDKRFCFDHYLPETTIDDLLLAHRTKRRVHTRKAVLAHTLETTHNDAMLHWIGIHGKPEVDAERRANGEAEAAQADAGIYVDVHAWFFSPGQFQRLMGELAREGLIDLQVERVHATAYGSLEFSAVLRKPGLR
ncbi:class I SAM-dependent methyltransferase [Sphingomonas sp. 1P08PE]|uniref:class I SAM-dependent methyltransferase n=1 Tax=Sphingomonas sp. 1P08PE TaxID=554122 RepID=UPI0039A33D7C